jgi:hypothetical protein
VKRFLNLYRSYLHAALIGTAAFVALLYPLAVLFNSRLEEANMNLGAVDLEALVRAISISAGVSLVGGATGYFVTKRRKEWNRWKSVVVMGAAGLALLSATLMYYAWPSLINVPILDDMSRDQAEELLRSKGLVPESRFQYVSGVEPGRVIPRSQDPVAGLPVKFGSYVRFAVSIREEQLSVIGKSTDTLSLSLSEPRAGDKVRCSRGGDEVYRFSASGGSAGIAAGRYGLLLWLRPVNPPSDVPGWYLQRPPANGILKVEADGTWLGTAQVGNAQWPPQEGDIIDLAVTIADDDAIKNLMAEPGVIVKPQPVGVKTATAPSVSVTLK